MGIGAAVLATGSSLLWAVALCWSVITISLIIACGIAAAISWSAKVIGDAIRDFGSARTVPLLRPASIAIGLLGLILLGRLLLNAQPLQTAHNYDQPSNAMAILFDIADSIPRSEFGAMKSAVTTLINREVKPNDVIWLVWIGDHNPTLKKFEVPSNGDRMMDSKSGERALFSSRRLLVASDFITDMGAGSTTQHPPVLSGVSARNVSVLMLGVRPAEDYLRQIKITRADVALAELEWQKWFHDLGASSVKSTLAQALAEAYPQ